AIGNFEARRINAHADTTPGAIETFVERNGCLALLQLGNLNLIGILFSLGNEFLGTVYIGAEIDHEPRQHGCVQARILFTVNPFPAAAILGLGFFHVLVADIDLSLAIDAFKTSAETFALATVVDRIENGAQ